MIPDYRENKGISSLDKLHHEIIKGENILVCWMGPECAVFIIPIHCKTSMKLTFEF